MEGGEWSNFNAGVCVNEEADFMAQLFPSPNDINVNFIMANANNTNNNNNTEGGNSSYYSCDSTSNSRNVYRYSQESSYNHEVHYHNYFSDNHLAVAAASNASSLPIDFLHCHMEDEENGATMDNDNADLNEDESQMDPSEEDNKTCNTSYNSKKRGRVLEVTN